MIGLTLTLVCVFLVCLVFASTRFIGVVGFALLFLLHPLLFLAFLCVGAIAFYFIHQHNRS